MMLEEEELVNKDWAKRVEIRLGALEGRQLVQEEKIDLLERDSLVFKESSEQMRDDLKKLAKEVRRGWCYFVGSPGVLLITVLILMSVYIIYNILHLV
jgi:uncharacterized coiled-coil protein SlyX